VELLFLLVGPFDRRVSVAEELIDDSMAIHACGSPFVAG
jgi:hypothetical protein